MHICGVCIYIYIQANPQHSVWVRHYLSIHMFVYAYIYTSICTYVYIHVHIHIYMYVCVYLHACRIYFIHIYLGEHSTSGADKPLFEDTYVCVCTYMYMDMYVYIHTCTYTYTYTCVYMHTCLYIYIHTYISRRPPNMGHGQALVC